SQSNVSQLLSFIVPRSRRFRGIVTRSDSCRIQSPTRLMKSREPTVCRPRFTRCSNTAFAWSGLEKLADLSLRNALVESMLIHGRAGQGFFEDTGRRAWRGIERDDILSSDFGFPARPLALPVDYRSRINTEVAHLSYTRARRASIKDREWEPVSFLPLLIRCIEFIDTCSKEELRRHEEFMALKKVEPLSAAQVKVSLSAVRIGLEAARQQRRSIAVGGNTT